MALHDLPAAVVEADEAAEGDAAGAADEVELPDASDVVEPVPERTLNATAGIVVSALLSFKYALSASTAILLTGPPGKMYCTGVLKISGVTIPASVSEYTPGIDTVALGEPVCVPPTDNCAHAG